METYERTGLIITEFDKEDVITTLTITPSTDPEPPGDPYEDIIF